MYGLWQVKWLAFEDVVDWDEIAVVVHRDAMAEIPALVAATDVEVRSFSAAPLAQIGL